MCFWGLLCVQIVVCLIQSLETYSLHRRKLQILCKLVRFCFASSQHLIFSFFLKLWFSSGRTMGDSLSLHSHSSVYFLLLGYKLNCLVWDKSICGYPPFISPWTNTLMCCLCFGSEFTHLYNNLNGPSADPGHEASSDQTSAL